MLVMPMLDTMLTRLFVTLMAVCIAQLPRQPALTAQSAESRAWLYSFDGLMRITKAWQTLTIAPM